MREEVDELASQILGLFKDTLQGFHEKFSHEDRESLAQYARAIAERTLRLKGSSDADERKRLESQIAGFKGAIALMTDRYLLTAERQFERTALKALETTAKWLLQILIVTARTAIV
jgi:hypothetical protein